MRTKGDILNAARSSFSTNSYATAGLRGITATAGANFALVKRYFGSKEGLFEAALDAALDVSPLIAGARDTFGRDVARILFDRPPGRNDALQMLILAAGDPIASAIAVRLLSKRIVEPLARWLDDDDSERAVRIALLCTGMLTFWRLLAIFPNGELPTATRNWFESVLQELVGEG